MDAVEEIKSRLSIEDVVSRYVELKRAGRNFKALSPFTNEKTASLMVSPEKQIWHDFSSGKGGDMFSFVMEAEGLDFKGALDMLARQAGVDLSQFQRGSGDGGKTKERLLQALELSAKFYQAHLKKNKTALDYVIKKRGFSKDTVLAFRIGFAPNQDAALSSFLQSKGFNQAEVKRAGLGTQRYRGFGDMFRGRIMIPLMDSTGHVIGFTARILDTKNSQISDAPKYINTPQTPVYDKGRHVFGLHLAKECIRKDDFVVITEGNLDVISSHQAGVTNVVATAGTALTEYQLKALNRFTQDVRLAFDQDRAGLNATERAIPIASKVGINLSIVTISEGKDPDELIRKDANLWQQAVRNPVYVVDWIIDHYVGQLDISSALGKRSLSDKVLPVVNSLADQVEKDHYLQKVSGLLEVSKDALQQKSNQIKPSNLGATKRRIREQPRMDKQRTELVRAQNQFLCLVFALPSLRSYLQPITAGMLFGEQAKMVFDFLNNHPDFNEQAVPRSLMEIADYVKMLLLEYEELYRDLEIQELRYEAARLQIRLVSNYVKRLKTKIALELQHASEGDSEKLLKQAKALDALLNQIKENS